MRIKLILAFPLDAAGVERRRAKIPAGVLADTTEVDYVPIIDAGKLLMDSYYNFALYEPFIIQQGVQAEEEGYDAVAVDTVSDVGVNALRSRLSIPVIGPGQAAYAVASMLGRKFSILTRWDRWAWLHDASLDAYGLRSQCVSIRAPKLPGRGRRGAPRQARRRGGRLDGGTSGLLAGVPRRGPSRDPGRRCGRADPRLDDDAGGCRVRRPEDRRPADRSGAPRAEDARALGLARPHALEGGLAFTRRKSRTSASWGCSAPDGSPARTAVRTRWYPPDASRKIAPRHADAALAR